MSIPASLWQEDVGAVPQDPAVMARDGQDGGEYASGLLISELADLGALDVALEEAPLELNECGLVAHGGGEGACGQVDDLDVTFLSDFLQPDSSSRVELLPASNESGDLSPTANSTSSDAADNSSSAEEAAPESRADSVGRVKRAKKSVSSVSPSASQEAEPHAQQEGQVLDRKARRRAQYEMMTLKSEAIFLEQQLETLRSKHKLMRADNAAAAWEERAIAQRHKRRQVERMNEQLRQALFMQSGFVRNLRSMFSESMPCSIELNMRNFLHTPTRLLNNPHSRLRNLEQVCTDAKLDMAKQIIMEETGGIKPWTTPHIACQQIDLGRDGFGMTTVAVYALETRNACKTFKATCNAIVNCVAVWPNYTLVTSSLKVVDLPPTKLNIRYGMNHNIYQSDTTGDRVSVESRDFVFPHDGELRYLSVGLCGCRRHEPATQRYDCHALHHRSVSAIALICLTLLIRS
ncbi:unnamed protein product [Phytophthora fragariaefolia]|uniref:Unnamed protein product n=1 Tax=Phytophthora fragariaefolia TaxID=1490495 RepID=A0A9W6YBR3_9STRA|nr:unnamed protein product [Phytophthora fragariaefolia]